MAVGLLDGLNGVGLVVEHPLPALAFRSEHRHVQPAEPGVLPGESLTIGKGAGEKLLLALAPRDNAGAVGGGYLDDG